MRFGLEVVKSIKSILPDDIPLFFRISSVEVLKTEQSLKKIYLTQENLKKLVLILSTVLQGVSEAHLF